jgi:hypothetical protein
MNYVQLTALFLRLGRSWQRLVQMSVLLLGAFLLFGAARLPNTWGQVWLTLAAAGYAATYLRDDRVLPRGKASLSSPEHLFYDTRHAFNPFALAATLLTKLFATIVYIVWAAAPASDGPPLAYLSFLVLTEHLSDLLVVEVPRLVLVVRGEHVPFLNGLWAPWRTDRAPPDYGAHIMMCGSPRYFAIAAEAGRKSLTNGGEGGGDEADIALDDDDL